MTSITLTTDLSDPSTAYTALSSVGFLYEVGINGVGYMLADDVVSGTGEPAYKYRRQTIPLDPQRLATTDTPFTEAIERYSFVAYSDGSGGAGQRLLDRPASDPARFFTSAGVNPFAVPGETTLLNALSSYALGYNGLREVVVGTVKYVQTAADTLTYYNTPGAVASGTVAIGGGVTIVDLATDGQFWYAACGSGGIFRGTTTVDGGAAWGAQNATVIDYAADRIIVAHPSTGSAPNRVRTLTAAGGIDATLITLDAGVTVTNFTGGNGRTYFGAYVGNEGVIYQWDNDNTVVPAIATDRIAGLAPRQVFYYQQQVLARYERRKSTTESDATIYRCTIDTSGALTPFFLVRLSDSTYDHGPGEFGSDDRFVYFTWRGVGLGVIDLSTGGYAASYAATANKAGHIAGLWQNRMCFSLDQTAAYYVNTAAYVTTGTLTMSVSDKASVLDKIADFITIVCKPLLASQSISLEWSTDNETWLSVTDGSLSSLGALRKVITFGKKSTAFSLRVTLAGGGTDTPTLSLVQLRLHPHGLADTVVLIPINCADNITNLQNQLVDDAYPGAGAARTRTLENLVQTRVLYQDIDYPTTLNAEVYEIINVEIASQAVYDVSLGRNSLSQVAIVTLRKAAK